MYSSLLSTDHPPHVLLLQELGVWRPVDTDFFLSYGFRVVTSFTRTGRGGGVAILVHSPAVHATPHPFTSPDPQIEVCAAFVSLIHHDDSPIIGVASLYYPPTSTYQSADQPNSLLSLLHSLSDHGVDLIGGDPNTWHPSWGSAVTCKVQSNVVRGSQVYSFILSHDWCVANTRDPTRFQGSFHTNPDLVLHRSYLNVSYSVLQPTQAVPLASLRAASDHSPILLSMSHKPLSCGPSSFRCRRIPWHHVKDWTPIQSLWASFLPPFPQWSSSPLHLSHLLHSSFSLLLSRLPQSPRRRPRPPPPLPSSLLRLRAEASEALRLLAPNSASIVRQYRSELTSFYTHLAQQSMDALTTCRKDCTWARSLWHTYSRPRSHFSSLTDASGRPLSSRVQATIFLKTFTEKSLPLDTPEYTCYISSLEEEAAILRRASARSTSQDFVPFSPSTLQSAIHRLNRRQCVDTYGISPLLFLHAPLPVLNFLSTVFSTFLFTGYVPSSWRRSVLIPLLKPNKDPTSPSSYRPVAITSLLCRLLEVLVVQRMEHLLRTAPLHLKQFGFRPGISADFLMSHMISSLVEGGRFTQKWHGAGNGSNRLFARLLVAVDFSDAFCRVSPLKIDCILRRRNFPEYLCRWLFSYLSGRSHRVWVPHRYSPSALCPLGCPQGSILGPLLWALFMDDLLSELSSTISLLSSIPFPLPSPYPKESPLRSTIRQIYHSRCICSDPISSCKATPWDAQELAAVQRLPNSSVDFGAYADDLSFWVISPSPHIAFTLAQYLLSVITSWASRNGILVSSKTEARWISPANRRFAHYPRGFARLSLGGGASIYIPPLLDDTSNTSVRVLGLYVDPPLTFRDHISHVQARVTASLRDFASRFPFMAPSLRAIILKAVCFPCILHLSPAFWGCLRLDSIRTLSHLWRDICQHITFCMRTSSSASIILTAGSRPLEYHVRCASLLLFRRIAIVPSPLRSLLLTPLPPPLGRKPHTSLASGFRDSPFPRLPICQSRFSPLYERIPFSQLQSSFQRSHFHTSLLLDGTQIGKLSGSSPALLDSYNCRQLRAHLAEWELWTDGSVEPGVASSAGFILLHRGVECHRDCITLGPLACSFSAERAAILMGLQYVHRLLSSPSSSGLLGTIPSLRIVSDSLSVLSELQRGPHYQPDEESEAIWFHLASCPFWSIDWIFIFSHTLGESPPLEHPAYWNAVVDQYASSCLSKNFSSSRPPWAKDQLRPVLQSLCKEFDSSAPVQQTFQYRSTGSGSPLPIHLLSMVKTQQRLLLSLRAGACRDLPGWRSERPEPCRRCGAMLGRLSAHLSNPSIQCAVSHIFCCPAFPLPPHLTFTDAIWFTSSPLSALRVAHMFLTQ